MEAYNIRNVYVISLLFFNERNSQIIIFQTLKVNKYVCRVHAQEAVASWRKLITIDKVKRVW